MINIDNNFFNNFNILLDKQSVDLIKQNLENYDELIFKNYKNDESLKKYKVKDKIKRTVIILKGKITFKRRRYYKINPETGKEEYIFLLDLIVGIEKWKRVTNDVKEKILSFITEKKRYKDILDTMENVKISLMTISNIMKNVKTDEEYYINKTNKKIDIPHTLYIQMDGTYLKMLDATKQGRKKIKKHTIVSTVHTGYDEEKYTVKRPVIANKLGVFEMDNIPDYLKKEANLKPVLIKLFTLIEAHYNLTPNIEIMILGDGALWIKNTKNFMHQYFPKNKIHHTIDKFHLTSRFKKLYPFQNKNKENRETYHKAVDYFYNAKYEELLQCLEDSKSFISDSKLDFLNKTITLIKNNEEGVKNQTLWNNVGCHMEGDISHYWKGTMIKKAIYSEKTIINKLNANMMGLKNRIDLFNSNEQLLEENRINYSVNNFVNNNLQPNLYFY
ncbi:Mbov_0401 family ICE element transposase-like protein [Spiroplasma endosymbiont of Polydrusus pterygomalis]|uniref:Mbov_0401 family ICE element transposase-like protein n=1 Tax=Spiroplasma endosymbiont of Polydrusus pterygomalis TaxID=3139327 RepID=UPI003CCB1BFC